MTTFLSGDSTMYKAYTEGKDLYAMIAQSAFDNEYSDNLEFFPEGTEIEVDGQKIICGKKTHVNKAGKERRSVGKVLNLAATYGMGGKTAGDKLGKTKEEGEKLLENFFKGFPGVKQAIDQSKDFLRKNGYVEDFVGRRRRLSDINLPTYTVSLKNPDPNEFFNPILDCPNRSEETNPKIIKWHQKIEEAISQSQKWQKEKAIKEGKPFEESQEMGNKTYEALAKEALADGVIIQANTGRIAQASRQCFNARIQGSSASLTKMAMIDVFNDPQLRAWNAHLIITVHDEVLVECPEEYAELVEKRLPQLMVEAAKKAGDDVPQACDPYNVTRWYADTIAVTLKDEFKKNEKNGKTREQALNALISNHPEFSKQAILDLIQNDLPELIF